MYTIKKEEIRKAVFDMEPWKAPGPNGYVVDFYQNIWDIIMDSTCHYIKNL